MRLIYDECPGPDETYFALGTREVVCELLKREFGIAVSVCERDRKAVQNWLDMEHSAIAARAMRKNGLIHCAAIIRVARATPRAANAGDPRNGPALGGVT